MGFDPRQRRADDKPIGSRATGLIERAERLIEHPVDGSPSELANQRCSVIGELVAELKQTHQDMEQLLAVATIYVNAFGENEMMTLLEKMELQRVEEIVERRGKRY